MAQNNQVTGAETSNAQPAVMSIQKASFAFATSVSVFIGVSLLLASI
jgi:hypothetical protein